MGTYDNSELSDAELAGVSGGVNKALPFDLQATGNRIDHIQDLMNNMTMGSTDPTSANGRSADNGQFDRTAKILSQFELNHGLEGPRPASSISDAEKVQVAKIAEVMERLADMSGKGFRPSPPDNGSKEATAPDPADRAILMEAHRSAPPANASREQLFAVLDKLTDEFAKMQPAESKAADPVTPLNSGAWNKVVNS